MKILHFVNEDKLSWAMPWKSLLLSMTQQDPSIDHQIVCRAGGNVMPLLQEAGFKVIPYTPRAPWAPGLCRGFKNIIKSNKPSLLHTRLSSAAAIGGHWGKKLEVPVMATVDKFPKGKYYRNTDHLVATSSAVMKHMTQEGFDLDSISVITNAIEVERYALNESVRSTTRAKSNLNDSDIVILGMGRFVAWKGFDLLLESVGKLKDPSRICLWLVGGGELESQLQELAKRKLAPRGIRYEFFPFAEDVRPFLWACDLFVQTSYHVPNSGGPETFSLMLLEAMASAREVIAFDCGGAPDVIQHGENGWLSPPGDVESLTKALELAISQHPNDRLRHQAVVDMANHDVASCARKYLATYQRFAKTQR